MILKCNGTNKSREKILNNKWLYINEETAYKIETGSNKTTELKIMVIFFINLNTRGKWNDKILARSRGNERGETVIRNVLLYIYIYD